MSKTYTVVKSAGCGGPRVVIENHNHFGRLVNATTGTSPETAAEMHAALQELVDSDRTSCSSELKPGDAFNTPYGNFKIEPSGYVFAVNGCGGVKNDSQQSW